MMRALALRIRALKERPKFIAVPEDDWWVIRRAVARRCPDGIAWTSPDMTLPVNFMFKGIPIVIEEPADG